MTKTLNDPLLLIGKAIAIFMQGVMAVGAAALVVGLGVILFNRDKLYTELAAEIDRAVPATFYPSLIGIILVGLAIVVMLFFFFGKLRQIIRTVGEGDPFQPANADRLSGMAWLLLGIHILFIPAVALGLFLAEVADDVKEAEVSFGDGLDLSGLLMVIVLFILARVFRKGTEMREELEGTV